MATFFDLYENGMVDIITIEKSPGSNNYFVGAFSNSTQDSDAYFVKVIVLSGKIQLYITIYIQPRALVAMAKLIYYH